MTFALFGAASIAACWKWGKWRNWRLYYPTVLYLLVGDLVSDYLLCDAPLFAFCRLSGRTPALDIAIMLLVYPSTCVLFLSFLPDAWKKQLPYLALWVGIYTVIEAIAILIGDYRYMGVWNLGYSVLVDVGMFCLLALHYKKPLLVWPVSAALAFLMLWWFRIPLVRG